MRKLKEETGEEKRKDPVVGDGALNKVEVKTAAQRE